MSRRLSSANIWSFYQQRFNADPYALVDHFSSEISAIAADAGVQWSSFSNELAFSHQDEKHRANSKADVIDPADAGKAQFWVGLREVNGRDGIRYTFPFINFTSKRNKRADGSWSGWTALRELAELEAGIQVDEEVQAKRLAAIRKREQERAARIAEAEARAKLERELVLEQFDAYRVAFEKRTSVTFRYLRKGQVATDTVAFIADEDGTAPYLRKKEISSVVGALPMCRMRDRLGEFTAFRLHDIHGNYIALQRLYADKKLQTVSPESGYSVGAHAIIGDIRKSSKCWAAEGFATGASVYLADGNPVIVCISSSNLLAVLTQYKEASTLQIKNAADNDCWKPVAGNTGMLTAIDVKEKLGIRSIAPNFDRLDARLAHGLTDWNDLYVHAGQAEVRRQLRAKGAANSIPSNSLDRALYRLQFAGTDDNKNPNGITSLVLKVANIGMRLVPVKYTGTQVCQMIKNAVPEHLRMAVAWGDVRSRVKWLANLKLKQARAVTGFTPETINQPHVRHYRMPVNWQQMPDGTRRMVMPPKVMQLLSKIGDGLFIIRSPMGSGKTEQVIAPLMGSADRAAYIAHRISLVGDAAARLSRAGMRVRNYSDLSWFEVMDTSHMACCVNSIIKPTFMNRDGVSWFETLDTLCIDEATQVLRHVVDGTAVHAPVRVFDALVNAIRSTRQVVMADAGANDQLIRFAELARPGEPIYVIEVDGQLPDVRVLHTDKDAAIKVAFDKFSEGNTVLVAYDSAEGAEGLAETFRAARPDAKVLLVHSDSKASPDVTQFQNDPNTQCTRWDAIIYSPSISSGVSITTPHFSHHIGIFAGVVSPADVMQMLRRDRTAREYVLGIQIESRQRITDREAVWAGRLEADRQTWSLEETPAQVAWVRKKTLFDQVGIDMLVSDNESRNEYANSLLLMMLAEGWRVEPMATTELDRQVGAELNSIGRAAAFQRWVTLVENESTPDDERAEKLQRAEVLSESEQAQLARHTIETVLCDAVNTVSIAFHRDQGIRWVNRMELLQATEAQTLAFDNAQRRAKVVGIRHRHKTVLHRIWQGVFSTLGVNTATGEGEFGVDECRAVLSALTADPQTLDMYNAIDAGPFIDAKALPRDATTFVKNFLARFNLVVHKRKTAGRNRYHITADSWAFMARWLALRAARGVHSLALAEVNTDGAFVPMELPVTAPQNEPEPAPVAASSDGDTLPNMLYKHANYPHVTERIERIFRAALPSNGAVTLRQALEWVGFDGGLYDDLASGAMSVAELGAYFEALSAQSGMRPALRVVA